MNQKYWRVQKNGQNGQNWRSGGSGTCSINIFQMEDTQNGWRESIGYVGLSLWIHQLRKMLAWKIRTVGNHSYREWIEDDEESSASLSSWLLEPICRFPPGGDDIKTRKKLSASSHCATGMVLPPTADAQCQLHPFRPHPCMTFYSNSSLCFIFIGRSFIIFCFAQLHHCYVLFVFLCHEAQLGSTQQANWSVVCVGLVPLSVLISCQCEVVNLRKNSSFLNETSLH